MPRSIRRQVWYARINRRHRTLLDREFKEEALTAFDADVSAERYGRTWRLSQPIVEPGLLVAKLGFERRSPSAGVRYDNSIHDFVEVENPIEAGNFVFFALDLETRLLAFEERKPDIKMQSFIGALTKIFDNQGFLWDIDLITDDTSLDDWLSDVDKVTRFRATVSSPNPNPWRHANEINEIISEPNTDILSIEALAGEDNQDGIKVEGTILGAIADHALDGNGYLKLTGLKGGARRFYDSIKRLATSQIVLDPNGTSDELVEQLRNAIIVAVSSFKSRKPDVE